MAVEVEGVENVDDLFASTDECVKFSENVHFRELELTLVWHLLQLPLSLVKTLLVLLETEKITG